MPNVSLCAQENEVHFNPYVPPYAGFCKLTLNNGETVELEGSGELTSTMTSNYKSTVVGAEIGTQCTSIGSTAFESCSGLTSVTIGNGVTSIGYYAFIGCSITSIDIPSGVTSIGDNAFSYCSSLTSVTIPNSVETIGGGAFSHCTSLTSVTILDSVTSIGSNAFDTFALKVLNYNAKCELSSSFRTSWSNLETVVIGDSTPSIGGSAFYNCRGLTSVTIGSGVTSINSEAFSYCSSLSTITSYIMNAPSVNPGTFGMVSNGGTLYVPIGSSGYETWMNKQGNLGLYNWTKVEQ